MLENSVRKVKKMEIVEEKLKEGKWVYQVKISGGGPELHRDENGNDWFREDELEFWP